VIARSILSTMRCTKDPIVYQRGSHVFEMAACATGGGPSFYRGESRQYEKCWYVTHSMDVRIVTPEWQVRFR
jgi:hypothetical protein